MAVTLHQLLKTLVEQSGTDLHVTTNSPPQIRVDGKLVPLQLPPLTAPETKALAYSVLTDNQKHRFEENLELDFSFGVRGLARFRANIFSQRGAVAAAFRERLHAKYDADEIRQSWITLTESDAISLIRIFCQLPYLPSGKTDPIARTILETYVTRLTHEKYAATYQKVVNSLRNMFIAKPDSPTLLNFTALVRWISPEAAHRLQADVGMPVAA